MKILLKSLFVLLLLFFFNLRSEAISFSEAYEQTSTKPMILLIYADWASGYRTYTSVMDKLNDNYGDKYNIVKLNIEHPDTAIFNSKFHIYPNLPYILMFKDSGKITRYIQRSCAADYSCVETKLKSFLQ